MSPADSAERWGNSGLDVLSTPAILGEIERMCDAVMKPRLADGEMTVGVSVTMRHRLPVRVGKHVEYRVTAGDFARKMDFSFEVRNLDDEIVCDGTHRRAVIISADFMRRLAGSTP
ncbi:hypothetical protein CcI156_21905 [Frankia sp. CcI156]|nr:hypothetical protein Manayef4_21405 [Frankia sp. CgIM4]ONH22179.1 hypothetical protein CcI156_21905 [Frankia sp. CcI156]